MPSLPMDATIDELADSWHSFGELQVAMVGDFRDRELIRERRYLPESPKKIEGSIRFRT